MKKTYQSPAADLAIFQPTESLAVVWEDLQAGNYGSAADSAANPLSGDIMITIKK